MTTKKDLRTQGIQRLHTLAKQPKLKQAKEQSLYQQLMAQTIWQEATVVGMVAAMPHEVATRELAELAWQAGKTVVMPRVLPNKEMAFYVVDAKTTFKKTAFGVLEPQSDALYLPKDISLLIVPGVVFQKDGYRIGFGGGFYDRYLVDYEGTTVSLVFQEQLQENLPVATYDIPVQLVITDKVEEQLDGKIETMA